MLVGLVVIGLAAWQAKHAAVATVFAFTGIATVVLGVILERLEGPIEFGATRLKATLRAVRRIESREDLTLTQKGDEVLQLFSSPSLPQRFFADPSPISSASVDSPKWRYLRRRPRSTPGRHVSDVCADPLFEDNPSDRFTEQSQEPEARVALPTPPLFVAGSEPRGRLGQAFVLHIAEAFRLEGWRVEVLDGPGDMGVDIRANRDDVQICVQVKLYRTRLSAADVQQFLGLFQSAPYGDAEWVLAVPEHSLTKAARDILLVSNSARLLEVPVLWED